MCQWTAFQHASGKTFDTRVRIEHWETFRYVNGKHFDSRVHMAHVHPRFNPQRSASTIADPAIPSYFGFFAPGEGAVEEAGPVEK